MLIYPTAGSGAISSSNSSSSSSSRMNASAGGQKGGRAAARGAVQRKAEATKTKSKQQTVLWKHADVEQGVVVVDEKQLMRLVKTEPIENYYRLDSEPFAKSVFQTFFFFTIVYVYVARVRGVYQHVRPLKICYCYGNVVSSLKKKNNVHL